MRRLVLLAAAAVAVLTLSSGSALGAARFYTPSYGSGPPEEIGGFDLGGDGSLAPIPSSPFPGEEAGTGGLWGIAFTPEGGRAISALFFGGGIQSYSVPASGVFSLASDVPGASSTGIAVTPDGRFAYAGTREFGGNPAEGIRRFSIAADGTVTPLLPNAADGEEFGDVAITPDGHFLFAAQLGSVERYAIGSNGSLTFLGSTPTPTAEFLAVSPDGRFLFLDLAEGAGLADYSISVSGGLAAAGTAIVTPGGAGQIFDVSPDGHYIYLPDSNNDRIYTFAIAEDGTHTLVGPTLVENPEAVKVSPDGRFLVFYEGGGSDSGIGVASIGPDGVPTVLPSFVSWDSGGEPERLTFQPQPTPVARFGTAVGAPGSATRFDAGASEQAARYDWDFGDGTTLANGGPTPAHTYARPGEYQVTLVVTDGSGCSTAHVYTGQSTICPGGEAARSTATVTVSAENAPPVLGKVRVVPRKFAPKVRGAKAAKVKLGTSFRYSVSEAATVRFKIERKKGKRFKKLGSRSQAAKAGANKLKWNGKLRGKPLPPGAYRATAIATDKEGGRSAPKTIGFRILPVPPLR